MKRKLPSFDEYFGVTKEPYHEDRYITDIAPIRAEEVIRNVREGVTNGDNTPQQLINQPQDDPVIDHQRNGGHNQIVLPQIYEDGLKVQSDTVFSFEKAVNFNFYLALLQTNDKTPVPTFGNNATVSSNAYVTYVTDVPWNDSGVGFFGTRIFFGVLRGKCTVNEFSESFINKYVDFTVLSCMNIDSKQLQVYEIVNKPKNIDLLVYFKRVFIMFNVIYQIGLFTNIGTRERHNRSAACISCRETYLSSNILTGLNSDSKSSQVIIKYLDIRRMIMAGYLVGRYGYFQVKFINNKCFIITNIFPKKDYDLPQRAPLSGLEQLPIQKSEILLEDFSRDIQNYVNEQFDITVVQDKLKPSYKYRSYKYKRGPEVKEYLFVDFSFDFSFPTAFAYHDAVGDRFFPYFFSESPTLRERYGAGTPLDTVIFTVESWAVLENFLLTVLFPEYYNLPPPQADDQNVNEEAIEHVEPPVEEQRPPTPLLQQAASQGFLPQTMETEDTSVQNQE